MQKSQSKRTSQGQVSVPASVRRHLQLMPGSVLEWTQDGDRILVDRVRRHTTASIHGALFGGAEPASEAAKTLDELKQGIREHMKRRHARA